MKILNLGLIVNFKETRGFSLYFKFFLEGNSQRVPSGTSPASPLNYISLSSPLSLSLCAQLGLWLISTAGASQDYNVD